MLNIYVTSPMTNQGKTFLTSGMAVTMQSLGYKTCVYKPIQTCGIEKKGFMQSPDLTYIKSLDPYINTHFSYLYRHDTEPLIASEIDENPIDIDFIHSEYKKLISSSDCLIIDGDGGLMSPVAPNAQNADIIKLLQIPILISVKPVKSAINNTLSEIFVAEEKGLNVRGVIINDILPDSSKNLLNSLPRVIEEYSNTKVLGLIPHLEGVISPEDMISAILNGIDLESVFNVRIERLEMN